MLVHLTHKTNYETAIGSQKVAKIERKTQIKNVDLLQIDFSQTQSVFCIKFTITVDLLKLYLRWDILTTDAM